MATRHQNPRILVVTPEITFVPHDMDPMSRFISARASGLGDVCAAQIHALYERGFDVHLAIPNYRNVFKNNAQRLSGVDIRSHRCELLRRTGHLTTPWQSAGCNGDR